MTGRRNIALLLVTSFLLSGCIGPFASEPSEEPSKNEVPVISLDNISDTGFGEAVVVRGIVSDETPSTTTVSISLSIPWEDVIVQPATSGLYQFSIFGLEPGEYTVTVLALDDAGLPSESLTDSFTVYKPDEPAPEMQIWRDEVMFNPEDEILVTGQLTHVDLSSCVLSHATLSGSLPEVIESDLDTSNGMFRFNIGSLSESASAEFEVTCGVYTVLTDSQTVTFTPFEVEEPDTDGDGVIDSEDSCPDGSSFVSSMVTDYDSDGCYDINEDLDDDADGVGDDYDECPKGELGWVSNPFIDKDGDGCMDDTEDIDDDGDGVPDVTDDCPESPFGWKSSFLSDYDSDGCRDSDADDDDDGDGVLDGVDLCPRGVRDWVPDSINDEDGDGCRDADEDDDDDNDTVFDNNDTCPRTEVNWPVDEFGCADYQKDTDGDGYTDDVDQCPGTPAGLEVNGDGCADLDGDGIFANSDQCPETPPRWTPDAQGCAILQLPVTWSTGPYSTNPYGTVGPMEIATTTGSWKIQDEWDGNSTYIFIFNYKSSSYMSNLWNQNPGNLLGGMPDNTHVFFGSFDTDYSSDISNMRSRVNSWLSGRSQETQDSWSNRIHYVNERAWDTSGSMNSVINDWSAFYYGIDRFQRWRQIGSLLDWSQGTSCCYRLDYIANEAQMYGAEFPVQMRHLDPAITSVEVFSSDRHSGGWSGGYTTKTSTTLPNQSVMAGFNTMEVYLEHSCSEHRDRYGIDDDGDGSADRYGGCHEWDYLHYLNICDADNSTQCGTEFVRYITTYGREGRWLTDISSMLWMVKDGGNRSFAYKGANGGWLNVTILLSNWDDDGVRPTQGELAFTGGKFNVDYNNESRYDRRHDVNISQQWNRVYLAAIVTGHGFGNDPNNCAEFCNHEHRFTLNGNDVTHAFPMAGNSSMSSDREGCKKAMGEGTVANQFGSWPYGRAGWCPGQDVKPWLFDITSWIDWSGSNEILYQGLWNGQQYTETSSNPDIRVLVWIIYFENLSQLGTNSMAADSFEPSHHSVVHDSVQGSHPVGIQERRYEEDTRRQND